MKIKSHPNEHEGIGPLFDKPCNCADFVRGRSDNPMCPRHNKKWPDEEYDFDGQTYEPKFDSSRLRGEMKAVYQVMSRTWAGKSWFTLRELSQITGHPEASISARIRDLRKARFGAHTVNRRRRGNPKQGIFEYQLL